jgi:hypothetical protein
MYTFYLSHGKLATCSFRGFDVKLKDVPRKHLADLMHNMSGLITNGVYHTSV